MGGGDPRTIFFPKLAVTVDDLGVFFACSGQGSDTLHRAPYPHHRVHFGVGGGGYPPPLFWGWGNRVLEKVGTVEELYRGRIMKKWGRAC